MSEPSTTLEGLDIGKTTRGEALLACASVSK